MHKGRVVFGAMEEVVFGRPASEAVVEQMDRLGASRALLMVSGTLNRNTDEIAKIRRALGTRYAATFDAMPPHTPRSAVIAAADQARVANADLIVIRGLGMPRSLREVKVGPENFDRIARQAMAMPWVPRNPRKIEVREILECAA